MGRSGARGLMLFSPQKTDSLAQELLKSTDRRRGSEALSSAFAKRNATLDETTQAPRVEMRMAAKHIRFSLYFAAGIFERIINKNAAFLDGIW